MNNSKYIVIPNFVLSSNSRYFIPTVRYNHSNLFFSFQRQNYSCQRQLHNNPDMECCVTSASIDFYANISIHQTFHILLMMSFGIGSTKIVMLLLQYMTHTQRETNTHTETHAHRHTHIQRHPRTHRDTHRKYIKQCM